MILGFTTCAGAQAFVEAGSVVPPPGSGGSVAWGDFDNDGDLDLLATGYRFSRSQIFFETKAGVSSQTFFPDS
jgi:hypothetical protein